MSSAIDPKPVVTGYPAAGTAYPYPAPPPHYAPYYPPPQPGGPVYANPSPNYNSTLFLRRLITAAIAVFLIIGAATLILWLVLRPRLPIFSLSSASVSSFNLSSSSQLLSSDFDLTLSVQNPNKKVGVSYYDVHASVFYGPAPIAQTSLPPFYQGKRNTTTIRARLAAVGEYVEAGVVKGIAAGRGQGGGGAVTFNFRVFSWVKYRAGAWRTRRHLMRVFCEDVVIAFKNATATVGSMVGPPKRCQVYL